VTVDNTANRSSASRTNTVDVDVTAPAPAAAPAPAILAALVVVIPAHNEEALIGASLIAMQLAVRFARETDPLTPHVEIVVVADACTDRTIEIASEFAGVRVCAVAGRNVGAARASGVQLALEQLDCVFSEVWIANTDADSVVPLNWITAQVGLARRGFDGMIGTVRPNFADLTSAQIRTWRATHITGEPNGHVHGANLGVRADAYLEVGGFCAEPAHEDVTLVDRLVAAGHTLLPSDDCEVITSGRRQGRAPEGYADYLRTTLDISGDLGANSVSI
jgi:glycosyltransferase involved in cell wall biosynthesis